MSEDNKDERPYTNTDTAIIADLGGTIYIDGQWLNYAAVRAFEVLIRLERERAKKDER